MSINMSELIRKAQELPVMKKERRYDLQGMFCIIEVMRQKGYKWIDITKFLNDSGINLGLETIQGYYYKRSTLEKS